MVLTTLVVVAVLFVGYILMSTEHINHINRAAVAMFCGVVAWVIYMFNAGTYLDLVHPEYKSFLGGAVSNHETVKNFIANSVIVRYVGEACAVILFLIATNTIVEVMNNNGVFDSLVKWLRMRSSRRFLWVITLLTFFISANIDNLTTVILMISIMGQIVKSRYQKLIYACAIMVASNLGGSFTVIGDMTTLMMWVKGVVTPTAFSLGLFLPAFIAMAVFNLLVSGMLHGKVEVASVLDRYDGDDSPLTPFQKILILAIGIVGLWSIPTFHYLTSLPPFIGALCVLALIWVADGICNLERNGMDMFVQRRYYKNTEFVGMRIILYFIGISLGVGALCESGFLNDASVWLTEHVGTTYVYGIAAGILSGVVDNVPLVMIGLNMFPMDTVAGSTSAFVQNGTYWQLLSYSCAMGGSAIMLGSLAGHSVMQLENIRISWFLRNMTWRVLVSWLAGMLVFWITHTF